MRIIFLDIDGVMNCLEEQDGEYIHDVLVSKLKTLKSLVNSTNSSIVLSSDRRTLKSEIERIKEGFDMFSIPFEGITRFPNRRLGYDCKGLQILDYIKERNDIDSFVIFDDNDEGISSYCPSSFILINGVYGLREDDCKKAEKILLRQ